MNPTLRRLGVAATAAAFAASIAVPAWAADPPAPDTPECVELVDLDPLVISARAALETAPEGLPAVDVADRPLDSCPTGWAPLINNEVSTTCARERPSRR